MGNKTNMYNETVSLDIYLPKQKHKSNSKKLKKCYIKNVNELVTLLVENNARYEDISYACALLTSEIRDRLINKIEQNENLHTIFLYLDRWTKLYVNDQLSIHTSFRECWTHSFGKNISWVTPKIEYFHHIQDYFPKLKNNPEQYKIVFPFAGSGLIGYFMQKYFNVEVVCSDHKPNTSFLPHIHVDKSDSYQWIRKQDLSKKIILFFGFPPKELEYGKGWGNLTSEEKENNNSIYPRKKDQKIVEYTLHYGNLYSIIYIGCPIHSGSIGFHKYLHKRFHFIYEIITRKSSTPSVGETLQIFRPRLKSKHVRHILSHDKPPFRGTILEFIKEECNS